MHTWIEALRPDSDRSIELARAEPALVVRAVEAIGAPPVAWAVEHARAITDQVVRDLTATGRGRAVTGHEVEACESGLLTTLVALHDGTPADRIVRGARAEENVRLAARQGTPIDGLLTIVWASHTRTHDALLRELEHLVPPVELVPLVLELNAALFGYVDAYVAAISSEYTSELVTWASRAPAARLRAMVSVLEGGSATPETERALGLRFTDHHLVAIARWRTAVSIEDDHAEIEAFAHRVARSATAASTLVLQRAGRSELWWTFAGSPPPEPGSALAAAAPPAELVLAVGAPHAGVDGFRRSHDEASEAALVADRAGGVGVWSHGDVRLLALLTADEAAARRFVQQELTGLRADTLRAAGVREALRLFLRSGGSRQAAASALHLAPTTVAYRVARAAELLDRPATERPWETLMALEIARRFPDYLRDAR